MANDSEPLKFAWHLVDHICRVCQGRVVKRSATDGQGLARYYRCTNCGLETRARTVSSLCCCGATMRTGRNLGIRCVRNENPRPECMSEIVAEVAEVPGLPLAIDEETES